MHSGSLVFRHHGLKMVGVFNRPDGKRWPGVLFLHGFPGSEKSVDIQRNLLHRGIASLELHFSGAWGSEGFYLFSNLVDQAKAGLAMLGRLGADPKRLGAFGFSMGGWTAVNLASRARLKAAAAVAPVGGPEMLTPSCKDFIAAACLPLRVRSTAGLYRDFARSVRAMDPAQSAAKLRCPLLLIHGDADQIVPPACSRRIYAAAPGPKKLVLAKGSGHSFIDRRDWLARLVSSWLAKQLK